MAIVSTHILNSLDGSHAGGVSVRLVNLDTGETLFETATDDGGRLKEDIPSPDPKAEYELAVDAGTFWTARGHPTRLTWIAMRFRMMQADGTYHSPIIFSPNGYSAWISG